MSDEERTKLATITAPYGRHIRLEEVRFDSGMRLLRVTIREGLRITVFDVDGETAIAWADAMRRWAESSVGE